MIERLLAKLARSLDLAKIPYMVIGGQAVLLYGEPRLTRDIDLTLGIDTDQFTVIEKLCRKLKLKILPENPRDFSKQTKVLPVEERKKFNIRIDFIFSFTPYERQAMKRVKKVSLGGYPVKFASPEDVIIHKMFAGRAVDLADTRSILLKQKTKLDLNYIRKWLSRFEASLGRKLLQPFNQLRRDK